MSQREDSFEGKAAMEALRSARGSLVVVTDLYEHRTLQEAAIYAGRAAGVFTSDGLSRSSGFCMIVTLTPNPERDPVHRRVTNVRIGFSGWNSRHLLAAIRR